jgi:hypothetical protein
MAGKIKLKPSTEPKIVLKPSTEPKIDTEMVAKALGAERVENPRYLLTNDPSFLAKQNATKAKEGHFLELSEEDWGKLCSLAQEFKEGEKIPSPFRVALVLLRKALREQLEGRAQMKAQLREPQAQAGE